MRKISSAASCVCATSSVNVPGRVMVFKKNRAAAQVVNPICRAFRTMFCRPRRRSNSRCAAFALSAAVLPARVLTLSHCAASAMPTVRPPRLDGRSSRIPPSRSSSCPSIRSHVDCAAAEPGATPLASKSITTSMVSAHRCLKRIWPMGRLSVHDHPAAAGHAVERPSNPDGLPCRPRAAGDGGRAVECSAYLCYCSRSTVTNNS